VPPDTIVRGRAVRFTPQPKGPQRYRCHPSRNTKFATMQKIAFFILLAAALIACNNTENASEKIIYNTDYEYFGDTLSTENAQPSSEITALLSNKDSVFAKLSGEVNTVCQKKGCWMTMAIDQEQDIFIRFRDYEFFVPLNCAGRTAVIEGWAYKETISVEELRHFAFDEDKTEEEINAITEPKNTYSFMANGVVLL
jgi:hypothetical protein